MQSLYSIDTASALRTAHMNQSILRLYREHLGEPGSHKAHEMLHTGYEERKVLK